MRGRSKDNLNKDLLLCLIPENSCISGICRLIHLFMYPAQVSPYFSNVEDFTFLSSFPLFAHSSFLNILATSPSFLISLWLLFDGLQSLLFIFSFSFFKKLVIKNPIWINIYLWASFKKGSMLILKILGFEQIWVRISSYSFHAMGYDCRL